MAGFIQDPIQFVNLIADNLRDRYQTGFPVLKELIQNTDDAQAPDLQFGLSKGLPGANHALLQGPALEFSAKKLGRLDVHIFHILQELTYR